MAIQAQFFPSNGGGSPFCDNGYYPGGLSESFFNSQQKQHHQHQQQLQQHCLQRSYNESQRIVDPNLLLHNSKPLNYNSPNFALQLDETDQYIRLQNEELRFMLQEQGKQQVAALVNRVESHSLNILREKDEEIAQATKKRVELEEFLRSLEAENQAWQKMAHDSEAAALSLYKTLEEMKEKASNNNGVVADDEESCCDGRKREDMEEGIVGENKNRVGVGGEFEMMVCKSCNSGRSCIMFLPCRHLCSCKACEPFLKACPVCRMPKKASIETLIS